MPLRAKHLYCREHDLVERHQFACRTCGLYGCWSHEGRALLCVAERARLHARFRRAAA
jgi:hypothetical protein